MGENYEIHTCAGECMADDENGWRQGVLRTSAKELSPPTTPAEKRAQRALVLLYVATAYFSGADTAGDIFPPDRAEQVLRFVHMIGERDVTFAAGLAERKRPEPRRWNYFCRTCWRIFSESSKR